MKHLIIIFLSTLVTISFSGCSSKEGVTPSENKALNDVSPAHKTKKGYYLQKKLDGWLKNDWTPTMKKNEVVEKKYEENSSRNFTLQEYVEKAALYIKTHPSDPEHSHMKKLESMPVIGK